MRVSKILKSYLFCLAENKFEFHQFDSVVEYVKTICLHFLVKMEFAFKSSDLVFSLDKEKGSDFDKILMDRWQTAVDAGICRYRLTNLKTKILSGKYGFVAQVDALYVFIAMVFSHTS